MPTCSISLKSNPLFCKQNINTKSTKSNFRDYNVKSIG